MMGQLEKAGFDVTGVDIFISGLRIAAERCRGNLICGYAEDIVTSLPVDAIAMFDIIEHIQDDSTLLKRIIRMVRPGGLLIVTVPAFRQLWSEFDERAGHKRRYRAHQLRQVFTEAGIEPLLIKYFFSFAVPLVWIQRQLTHKVSAEKRKRNSLDPPAPAVNAFFTQMARIERSVMRTGFSMPFGTSLIGLARIA